MSETALRSKLEQVNEQIAAKNAEAATKWTAFKQARDEFASAGNDANRTDSDEFKKAEQVHKEYAAVAAEVKQLEEVRDGIFAMVSPGSPAVTPAPQGSAGKRGEVPAGQLKRPSSFVEESVDYKAFLESHALDSEQRKFGTQHLASLPYAESKALITGASDTSAGAFVVNDVKPYVAQPQRPFRLFDLITLGETTGDTVEYVRQSAYTGVGAIVAEATDGDTGTKPEATMAFAKVTAAVETLAVWIPATRRALRDAGQMRTLIDSQLRYDLLAEVERQVANGSGTGEFTGIINTGSILSQAKGSDSTADAIHKAITQIRLGFIEPSAVGMHPNDWQLLRLSRDDAGSVAGTGAYLYGPPALAGQPTVWGLPVAVTAAVPDDTAIVGDWSKAVLWQREGIELYATDSHSDWFIKNLIAVLAELAAAFGVLLPQAFCKVTSVD